MRWAFLWVAFIACVAPARADLYVAGFNSGGVYRFDADTGAAVGSGVFIAPGSGGLSLPHGVMRLADGTFIVASAGTDEVLRYSGSGAYLSAFMANGQNGVPAGTLDYPVDFALGPNGDLFVTSQLNDRVVRVDALTGAFISIFVASGTVDGPSGLTWHPATGDLYVVARFGNQVARYDHTGAVVAGFAASGFNQPFGIAAHPVGGDLYVVNGGANSVRRISPATGATAATLSGGLGFPIGVRFGPGGDVFVANFGSDRIARFDGLTGDAEADLVTAATAAAAGLDGPNFFNFVPAFTAQESWRLQHFGIATNAGAAADGADADGDGWNNLLEFATGGLPNASEISPLAVTVAGGVVSFSYPRNLDAVTDGWLFVVEWSDSLSAVGWETVSVTESVTATAGNIQTILAELPAGDEGRRFVRLRVHR